MANKKGITIGLILVSFIVLGLGLSVFVSTSQQIFFQSPTFTYLYEKSYDPVTKVFTERPPITSGDWYLKASPNCENKNDNGCDKIKISFKGSEIKNILMSKDEFVQLDEFTAIIVKYFSITDTDADGNLRGFSAKIDVFLGDINDIISYEFTDPFNVIQQRQQYISKVKLDNKYIRLNGKINNLQISKSFSKGVISEGIRDFEFKKGMSDFEFPIETAQLGIHRVGIARAITFIGQNTFIIGSNMGNIKTYKIIPFAIGGEKNPPYSDNELAQQDVGQQELTSSIRISSPSSSIITQEPIKIKPSGTGFKKNNVATTLLIVGLIGILGGLVYYFSAKK